MKIEEKYHEPILELITQNGKMGVTALSTGTGIHRASLQKYLNRQTYFKKTADSKWDLPEKVNQEIIQETENNKLALLANSIDIQTNLVESEIDRFSDTMADFVQLIRKISPIISTFTQPVAKESKSTNITNESIIKLNESANYVIKTIKANYDNMSESYRDLLLDVDIHRLMVFKGMDWVNGIVSAEFMRLVLADTDEVSDDTMQMLKFYQKGTDNGV